MITARDLFVGDKVFIYDNNGNFISCRTIKRLGINRENELFFHFGFDKDGKTMNSYPKFSDTYSKISSYPNVKTHDNELVFFSKESVSEYFAKKNKH